MDTIRRLEWKSVFDTVHGYIFRYHKAGDDRIRPSAGSDNADIHAENSRAVIDTIYGNTVKWNQLVRNGDFSNGTTNWLVQQGSEAVVSTTNGILTCKAVSTTHTSAHIRQDGFNFITNHKYCIKVGHMQTGGTKFNIVACNNSFSQQGVIIQETPVLNTWYYTNILYLPSINHNSLLFGFSGMNNDNNEYYSISNVQVFDLTLLGIDNLMTTDQVDAWLALNVGEQDYYPYDAGSLISFGGTAIKSVGFNQWNGATAKVLSGQEYYIGGTYTSLSYSDGTSIVPTNRLFTANKTDNVTITGGSTDTVLNLSCDKNGTYAPYWEDSVDLSFAQNATGKLLVGGQPTGDSVVVFPDGMKSASSVHDTAIVDDDGYISKVTKNFTNTVKYKNCTGWYYGSVDNTHPYGYIRFRQNSGVYDGQISSTSYSKGGANFYVDKRTFIGNGFIYIIDSSYTSTTSFLQDHGEDSCFWQISPEEYLLDTPIVATYKVDKYSTEELIVPTSQTGAPTSTALNADIDYQYRG